MQVLLSEPEKGTTLQQTLPLAICEILPLYTCFQFWWASALLQACMQIAGKILSGLPLAYLLGGIVLRLLFSHLCSALNDQRVYVINTPQVRALLQHVGACSAEVYLKTMYYVVIIINLQIT